VFGADIIAVAPELPKQEHGTGKAGPGRGNKTGYIVTRFIRGNSTEYLTSRIKRDRPDIAARGKLREFP
jgi:hypothetical protein